MLGGVIANRCLAREAFSSTPALFGSQKANKRKEFQCSQIKKVLRTGGYLRQRTFLDAGDGVYVCGCAG
jgi:hypothetical protein